ncbi:glycosyltransferase family 2 protein [Leptodesmis sp.]|uniref:glycosyltransferase family 2 protein n=1 Tax=Leptodesmis sp. TaxID=3100501 RepID=UPI0040534ACE
MSFALPIVSVIMPCFNQGAYLDEAVGSVLAQTCESFEIIVINDGSTDRETVRILEKYDNPEWIVHSEQLLKSHEKPNLTVIHTPNRGPSAARNTGIRHAKGRYILPLDADDRIAPTYLEKAITILDNEPSVGIVYCQAELFGDRTELFDLPPYNFPKILLGNMIVNTSLYRKADWEKVGGYNENMIWGWEDYDFWLSLIELGREVVRIPEILYFHRELPNSRSQQMTRDSWVKSYTQLFANHSQLYSTHISTLFQELVNLRDDLHQTHCQLHALQAQLLRSQAMVSRMQSSKFWQLRNQWFKLKKRLGFKGGDDLFPV